MGGRSVFSLTCIWGVLLLGGCRPNGATPQAVQGSEHSAKASSVLPIQATVNLGVIFQGESSQIKQWLKNHSDKPIRIAQIFTSCECLEVHLSQLEIARGQKVLATFQYDGAKEPDFVGALQIEVTFADSDGNTVGRFNVPLEVVSSEHIRASNTQ